MAYCGPRGLALSVFEGWEPLDQQMALEWQRRENEKCGGCGIHPDVTDPERGGDPNALGLASWLCLTCEQAERQREEFQKNRAPGEHQMWRRRPPEVDDGDSSP
jgi:hypothetical protein